MAERGRQPGFQMGHEHRLKIANSNILNRLIKAAEGELTLDAVQLRAIEIALKKVLPDLTNTQISGDEDSPIIHRIERVIVDPKN